jgi:hypothetical protein
MGREMEIILKFLKGFGLIIFSFLAPVWGVMVGVGLAIAIDTVMGAYYAHKEGRFNSEGLRIGLTSKMLVYQIIILSIFGIDTAILMEFTTLFNSLPYIVTKLAGVALIIIELVSMKENFEKIYNVNIVKVLKKAIGIYKEVKNEIN